MKLKKFGIYGRVSTLDKQDVEVQLRELRNYAQIRGWEIKEYVDIGQSGAKEKRPALDSLMNDVRKRKLDGILVWKLDRFGRSLKSLVNTLEELRSLGIQFVSYTENLDFSTPAGRAMANLIGVFAEFERDLIRERVIAGLANAKAKGKKLGRPNGDVDIEKLLGLRRQGLTVRGIAKEMKLSVGFVHKTLKNYPSQSLDKSTLKNEKVTFV
jgi:putative DNA-invertase from lambdoid prophage Rac